MKRRGDTWAIVLALGESPHPHCAAASAGRRSVPAQYCAQHGGPSPLELALRRAAAVTEPLRTWVIVADAHRPYWQAALSAYPQGQVVAQAVAAGSAIGVLAPLTRIVAADPEARIVVLPADQFVRDEDVLATALRRSIQVVNLQPHKVILLGVRPDRPETGLGYLVPGPVNGPGTSSVRSWVDRPPQPVAAELVHAGALWNTGIVAADSTTLMTLFRTRVPDVCARLDELPGGDDPELHAAASRPGLDFYRGILEGAEPVLRVMPVGPCGWTDLASARGDLGAPAGYPRPCGICVWSTAPQQESTMATRTSRGGTAMKSDTDIRRDVQTELEWDPSLDARDIGVIVRNGVVTLTGEVRQFADRWNAEDITKRVSGVLAIANEIEVRIPIAGMRSDTEIAEAAANALRWHVATAHMNITPVVKDGWITLSGEATWGFQKNAAEAAMRHLIGVKGVTNSIRIAGTVKAEDVKHKIEEAFRRHALLDANDIEVRVEGGTVTLQGRVHSWQEHEDATRASWSAPGVANVENRLAVQ